MVPDEGVTFDEVDEALVALGTSDPKNIHITIGGRHMTREQISDLAHEEDG